ncbi:hypothetical protein [Streptacidiphilus sp. MAP5-3]|uniref:hypothetical protein n=1 Tax=unclassified Streptacidiphilus TaxID=2643834 RepID=UPI0035156D1F
MTDEMPPGLFFVPVSPTSAAPPRTLPSGLVLPDLSWAATRLGLVWAGDDWLKTAVSAYLSASEYFGVVAQAKGFDFEPRVWIETLLRMYPAESYLFHLARLNRTARSAEHVSVLQQRFLQRLQPGLRLTIETVLGGLTGGPTRWFLARQPVLRAMHLALTTQIPKQDPDPRVAHYLQGIDPESAAIVLAHLAADTLSQSRPANEPQLGGTSESSPWKWSVTTSSTSRMTPERCSPGLGQCGLGTAPNWPTPRWARARWTCSPRPPMG